MTRLFFYLFIGSLLINQLFASNDETLQRDVSLMGTTLRLTLYEPDHNRAMSLSEEWIRMVEQTEQQWSNWRETSEISQLNHQPIGSPFQLSKDLCKVLPVLQNYNQQTRGAFDPGIGQLLKIWGHYGNPQVASKQEVDHALKASGIQKLLIDPKKCTAIRITDLLLDAGGFGKGLALERILNHAQTNQTAAFLADFGGQLLVYSRSQEVELADPENRNAGSGIRIQIQSGSLSTSGGSEHDRFIKGKRIGHIIDPHNGKPVVSKVSVTVWHQSALAADILSTALYVLGPEKGLEWANKNQVAACYLERRNGILRASKSMLFKNFLN